MLEKDYSNDILVSFVVNFLKFDHAFLANLHFLEPILIQMFKHAIHQLCEKNEFSPTLNESLQHLLYGLAFCIWN